MDFQAGTIRYMAWRGIEAERQLPSGQVLWLEDAAHKQRDITLAGPCGAVDAELRPRDRPRNR